MGEAHVGPQWAAAGLVASLVGGAELRLLVTRLARRGGWLRAWGPLVRCCPARRARRAGSARPPARRVERDRRAADRGEARRLGGLKLVGGVAEERLGILGEVRAPQRLAPARGRGLPVRARRRSARDDRVGVRALALGDDARRGRAVIGRAGATQPDRGYERQHGNYERQLLEGYSKGTRRWYE